jgi:phosphoribosylformylglycinamidine (FGAM) synthase-like enzyme
VALFGEEQGAFIVAVPAERWEELQQALAGAVGYDQIGTVGGDRFMVEDFIDLSLDELRDAYEKDLFDVMVVPEEMS